MATADKQQPQDAPSDDIDVIAGLGLAERERMALGELGDIEEPIVQEGRLYSKEFEEAINAMPKVPVWIPGEFAEFVQVNGYGIIINPERVVMVPQVFKEVLDNRRDLLRTIQRNTSKLQQAMSYSSINQVPKYVR